MPKYSVIMPLYNKAAYIKATLNSVLAQDYTDFEVVIADDGSTDGSADIVKNFTDTRIKYFRKENEGASSARNYAMKNAKGDYFAFLDADDIWRRNHLQEFEVAIAAMPHIKVFASLLEVENRNGIYKPLYSGLTENILQENNFFRLSYGRCILSGSTTVIHRSVADSIGKFDTDLITCEDTDYWIRIGMNYKIGVINQITARQTYVPGSLSKTRFSINRSTYFEKFTGLEKENPEAKKMIDINRYSLALRCKIAVERDAFLKMVSLISPGSLTWQQKTLLKLPGVVLLLLQRVKQYVAVKF